MANSIILKDLIAELKLTTAAFERQIEAGNGTIYKAIARGTDLQSWVIEKIVHKYPNVNPQWLVTGEGNKFIDENDMQSNSRDMGPMDGGELGKTKSGMDYMEMGEGRYLLITPLVTEYSYGGYLKGYKDSEYIEEMPKHSIVVSSKPHGVYRSFEMRGDSMNNGLEDAIKHGDTVTGRLIDKRFWTSKLHIHQYKEFIIVHKEGIITKEIYKHDVEKGILYIRSKNEDKNEFPDDVIYLKDVKELYNVIEVSKKRK